MVTINFQSNTIAVHALAIRDVKYDILLSRAHMKELELYFYWGNTVLDDPPPSCWKDSRGPIVSLRIIKTTDGVAKVYPVLVCAGDYPPSTTKLEVPLELNDKPVVRKRPYNLTRSKKLWLRQEFQSILDSDINQPSASSFASPITIVLKGGGMFRFYTGY